MQSAPPGLPAVRNLIAAAMFAAALLWSVDAAAQTADGLTLQAVLERALQANPEVLAAHARIQAAATRPSQAGSLPDPMLTGVLRNVGFGDITIGEEMMAGAGVRFTQSLPYGGKRDLRRAVAETGVDVATARLELIRRRVVREAAIAYFELAYLYEATAVVDDTRAYLADLEETAQARYAVGEGIQQDVLRAQVEISALLERLIVLEQQRESVETELHRLLDQPPVAPLGVPQAASSPPWELSLEELVDEAGRGSAVVRERARQVRQQEATLDLARRDTKPDWVLGGSWLSRGDLPDVWEVNVGLTLPIYKGSKQEPAIEEATAQVRVLQFEHRDATVTVAAAVREHWLHADRAARLVRLYREAIIPQASLSLESAIVGYEVGRVDFLTVLDNVVTLLTYRLEDSRQATDYLQALAAIEEHLGRSLGVTPATILQRARGAGVDDGTNAKFMGGER